MWATINGPAASRDPSVLIDATNTHTTVVSTPLSQLRCLTSPVRHTDTPFTHTRIDPGSMSIHYTIFHPAKLNAAIIVMTFLLSHCPSVRISVQHPATK